MDCCSHPFSSRLCHLFDRSRPLLPTHRTEYSNLPLSLHLSVRIIPYCVPHGSVWLANFLDVGVLDFVIDQSPQHRIRRGARHWDYRNDILLANTINSTEVKWSL